MMEGDVRKKGMLYHQQQRFGKKWKKVWAEAVGDSAHSLSCLELYEFSKSSMKENKKRPEGKKVIVMRDCVKITEKEAEGCPKECNVFQLETAEKTHTFASPTSELQSWIMELCKLAFPLNQSGCRTQMQEPPVEMQDNTLYGTAESVRDFLVVAVATEAAVRCNLNGEYLLTPQYDSLLLKNRKTKQVLLTWPYRFVRKFGQDMLSFNFEAGRRCESGEGYFEFATSHSDNVFAIISNALKKLPKVETPGTRPKEQQVTQNYQQSHTPPAQIKHPKKKLTTSNSLSSINLSNNPSKDNKVKSINSTPPLSSDAQDPVYAIINKAKLHSKSSKDYKNQQLGPLPDFIPLSEDISDVLEEEDQLSSEHSAIHGTFDNYDAESVYSEVKNYDDYRGQNEAVDYIEEHAYFYELDVPNETDCSDLNDMGDEKQLDMSMELLAIHDPPNVYGAESMYSEVMVKYDDYGGIEESVDNVEDQEYFFPPCPSDLHFNLEDSQDEGFSTYDNLPNRL